MSEPAMTAEVNVMKIRTIGNAKPVWS